MTTNQYIELKKLISEMTDIELNKLIDYLLSLKA